VPGYDILAELGRGGMGVVYRARQTKLGRVVALKMILSGAHASEADLARFRTEAEAIARLQHPNIVQIYEVGDNGGLPYFSLEFCGGGSLEKRMNGTPLPPKDAAALVETLARAMRAAHDKGVIHRDLKPANVLLADDGIPKITDFGLAKKIDEAGQTASGAVMGTPSYMAPEQAGGKGVGPLADVYALGAILYACLTGRPPFRAAAALDTLMQVLTDEPVPPAQLQSKTPRDLETICLKCLQKQPERRYASAGALADDLARWQRGEPIHARRAGPLERLAKWCRRRPAAAALLVVTFAATVGGLTAGYLFTQRLRERLWQAQFEQARAERLAGNRERSLAVVQEALKFKNTPELRDLAVQSLLTPGLRPLDDAPPGTTFVAEPHYHAWNLPPALPAERQKVRWLSISADLGVGAREERVRDPKSCFVTFWDLRTGEQLSRHDAGRGTTSQFDCCLSRDGRLFAYALHSAEDPRLCADDKIRIVDTRTGKLQAEVSRSDPYGDLVNVSACAFSPDGMLLAGTLLGGRNVRVWDVSTGLAVGTTAGDSQLDAWDEEGRLLRVKNGQGRASPVWAVSAPPPTRRVGRRVESLSFHPDGKLLAVNASLWEVGGQRGRLWVRPSPREVPGFGAVLDSEGHVWSWSEPWREKPRNGNPQHDLKVYLTDKAVETRLTEGPRPGEGIQDEQNGLAFTRDGSRLLIVRHTVMSGVFGIELWDCLAGKKLADWLPSVREAEGGKSSAITLPSTPQFSDDGTYAGFGSSQGLLVWEVSTGRFVRRLESGGVGGPWLFSPEGRRAYLTNGEAVIDGKPTRRSGRVTVCDIESGEPRLLWDTRRGADPVSDTYVSALAARPDGRLLAVGDHGGKVWLLDTRTGRELASWDAHEGEVSALRFSPDGRILTSGSGPGAFTLLDLSAIREGLTGLGFDWPE
jgi:WD40 repeat protein/tRNA A-37 threonylcarbamoyl transferase component Bud32